MAGTLGYGTLIRETREQKGWTQVDLGERVRERAREWWALNRDAALAQRRERLAALPPEEQARLREQARTASREWQRRLREWRATDPEAHAAYLASQAEYRRRAALAALGSIATQLESRLEDPR